MSINWHVFCDLSFNKSLNLNWLCWPFLTCRGTVAVTAALCSGAGTGYCSERGGWTQTLHPAESDRPDGDIKRKQPKLLMSKYQIFTLKSHEREKTKKKHEFYLCDLFQSWILPQRNKQITQKSHKGTFTEVVSDFHTHFLVSFFKKNKVASAFVALRYFCNFPDQPVRSVQHQVQGTAWTEAASKAAAAPLRSRAWEGGREPRMAGEHSGSTNLQQ